jgi:siphovirus|nr:MAG TPA: resistance protein [Caudoviricetes sp.]
MATIYELSGDYLRLLEMAEDPEMDPVAFADTLEGLEGEIEIKAEGYAKVIKELDKDGAGLDNEIKRLQAKKTTIDNSIDRMKKALEQSMIITGKTKFKTELFSFGIQKNPPSVDLDEEHLELIPIEYLIPQDPKPDKKRMLQELKEGKELSFAKLKQTESLRIR